MKRIVAPDPNQAIRAALGLVASCTALVACAPETPLDHYWTAAHCEVQVSADAPQYRLCEAYLRRQSSTDALLVRLGTDFYNDHPAHPTLLAAINPSQTAPASVPLTGTHVLLRGPATIPVGQAYLVVNSSGAVPGVQAPWTVATGQLDLVSFTLGENRTDDRDAMTLDLVFNLSGAMAGGIPLTGMVTIHAQDEPANNAGALDGGPDGAIGTRGTAVE
jgi:hypothetical protein